MSVYILAAARTPLGTFGGRLRDVSPTELAAHALGETLRRSQVPPDRIDQVILGSVHTGLQGGNPALLAARMVGLPDGIRAYTISAGSATGLEALALAAQSLQQGRSAFILAGGVESASQAPYLLPGARWGVRFGEADLLDSLLISSAASGQKAETIPAQCLVMDDDLAAWTEGSQRKVLGSRSHLAREIAPLSVLRGKQLQVIHEDEPPEDSPIPLRQTGLATPGDGAVALLLSSTLPAESQTPLARILDWVEMGADAADAVRRLLRRIGLTFQEVNCWEIHEASATHLRELLKEMQEIDPALVNLRGGALALGDPMGASGARMVASLAFTLQAERLQTGIALIPSIGGPGIAMAISRS